MFELRDGTRVEDPRLGRLTHFDERSRNYPVTAGIEAKKPRSYHWRINNGALDQGREGACVGFAWTHELLARPAEVPDLDARFAREVYHQAQRIDQWPGGTYPGASPVYDGTSILAGAKSMVFRGYIGEYRWAFGLNDLILALGYKGPAVLGIPWYSSMYQTEARGSQQWVNVNGNIVGGHAIVARGVNIKGEYVTLHNSWGPTWGINGDARISFSDLDKLLKQQGEACIPVERYKKPKINN